MGIGLIAISTNQKKDIAGPPFSPTSADNGLSVDSVTGRIVLGNDVGDPAQPGALLTDREIVTEDSVGNLLTLFLNAIQNLAQTELNGLSAIVRGQDNTLPSVQVIGGNTSQPQVAITGGDSALAQLLMSAGVGGFANFRAVAGSDLIDLLVNDSGQIDIGVSNFGVPITMISFDTANLRVQIGATQVGFNGATVQLTGSVTRRLLITGKGAGTYNVDRDLDSDVQFINSGAANFQLPNMVGANNRSGFVLRVCVKNVAGITVTASAGQVMRFGSLATSSGGTLSSTDVGAYLKLVWDGSNWITETFNGAWSLT